MTLFADVTAYAIAKNIIADNAKLPGFAADSLDEIEGVAHAEVIEISANLFVALAWIGEAGAHVMTTALGEISTFKNAGSALEAIKLKTFLGSSINIKKLPRDSTPTDKKSRVSRYKTKFAERIKALGNLAALQLRIDATAPGALKNELLERKDAVDDWVTNVGATVAALKVALAADGVDADTLVY